MDLLINDVLLEIFKCCDINNMLIILTVNKQFYNLKYNNTLWTYLYNNLNIDYIDDESYQQCIIYSQLQHLHKQLNYSFQPYYLYNSWMLSRTYHNQLKIP